VGSCRSGEEEGVRSAWSSGRRSGGCTGSSGCRSARSAAARVCIARRFGGRWRRRRCPPNSRPLPASKLDPVKGWIGEQLRRDPGIQSLRLRELASELGHAGGKTIFDDYVREVRPRFRARRTFQRTIYRPGELVRCDLWEPREPVPVGHGQTRRGWIVNAELCWSRVIPGTLIFSKQAPDVLRGLGRCLARIGPLPETLVWDREGAIHAGGGRPTDPFAGFCGELRVGWLILEARDPEAKGALERSHRFLRTSFEPGRSFANELDYQAQLDAWCVKANGRIHRTLRCRPSERLAEERKRMRPLPERLPNTERRFVTMVPQQPYLRFDTNDYSLDPRLAGRRVEVRVSQTELAAVCLDSGGLACRHRRRFARHLTFTDPAHQHQLERLHGARRRGPDVEVELRPLARYDRLIPA
jgi:hypothetical protein